MSAAKHWKTVRLGDVAKTSSGGTPKRGHVEYYGGEIPWVKSGELGDSTVYEATETITETGLKNSSAKLFPKGTLCIALYGATIGRLGVLGVDAATNQAVCGIFLPDDIDTRFVYCFLESKRRDLVNMGKGGAQPNISQGIIRDLELPLPPLDEQYQIVAEIEKQFTRLDAGMDGLKRVQANLNRYRATVLKAACEGKLIPTEAALCGGSLTTKGTKSSKNLKGGESESLCDSEPSVVKNDFETGEQLLERILIERRKAHEEQQKTAPRKKKYKEPAAPDLSDLPDLPEGWVWASVEQVADVALGKMLDKKKHQTGKKLSYLRNINVRWGSVDTRDVFEMFFEEHQIERYGLRSGDVLVCEGGEPGRAAVWDGRDPCMMYQKALHRVRFFCSFDARYFVSILEYQAKSGRLERWFTGSTIKHFTRESFVSLPVPLPPRAEQKRIVEEVERRLSVIKEMETAVAANLKRAARLRQSILKKAFEGKLV